MNAPAKIEMGEVTPFNPMAAYQAERAENERLYGLLTTALFMLDSDTERLERHGYDVAHRRAWIARAKKERFAA